MTVVPVIAEFGDISEVDIDPDLEDVQLKRSGCYAKRQVSADRGECPASPRLPVHSGPASQC